MAPLPPPLIPARYRSLRGETYAMTGGCAAAGAAFGASNSQPRCAPAAWRGGARVGWQNSSCLASSGSNTAASRSMSDSQPSCPAAAADPAAY